MTEDLTGLSGGSGSDGWWPVEPSNRRDLPLGCVVPRPTVLRTGCCRAWCLCLSPGTEVPVPWPVGRGVWGSAPTSTEPAMLAGLRYAGAMRLHVSSLAVISVVLSFAMSACFADTTRSGSSAAAFSLEPSLESSPETTQSPGWLRWQLPREWSSAEEQRRVLLAGAALIATDRLTVRLFDTDQADPLRTIDWSFRPFNKLADGLVLGTGLTLAWSVQRGESRQTTATALTALANSTVATTLVKGLVGKQRPDQSMEPHYRGPSLTFSSFPSGHTAAAASVAHVFARKHPRHRAFWYGFVALVAVSRVSSAKHWLSDTAWGAGIGVLSAEGALRGDGPAMRFRF